MTDKTEHHLHHDGDSGGGISVFARLRGYFLAGILVTAPLGITVFLTYIFIRFIDEKVAAVIPDRYNPNDILPFSVPGLGLVIVIAFLISVGWFAKNFFGRLLITISENIVDRMPVVRNLYGAIKQIVETIMASQSQAFRDVVMLEYPRKGVFSIGFVTGRSQGEIQRVTADETVNVFVPTTPNPTSGYLLFVPRKELYFLDMTVEEGVKLVISGGIITPPDRGDKKAANIIPASPDGPAIGEAAEKAVSPRRKTPANKSSQATAQQDRKPVAKRKKQQ